MSESTIIGNTARLILTMHERTSGLAEALRQGIEPAIAASMPTSGGEAINCNHATFVYGHLGIYPQMIMRALGTDPGDAAVPESYEALFQAGVACQHDPENRIYPALDEVFGQFQRGHKALHEYLALQDDAGICKPIVDNERAAEFFGSCDAMALFMLHDHFMFHLGQLSTWRRCMGLGSAM